MTTVGRWTIQRGYSDRTFETQQIVSESPGTYSLDRHTGTGSSLRIAKSKVLTTYETEAAAKAVLQKLRGCRGELEDRERAARKAFADKIAAIIAGDA